MALSRRDFCALVGTGVPVARLRLAPELPVPAGAAPDPVRLDSNENPYGPSPAARQAIVRALGDGGRYPSTQDLIAAIARATGAGVPNVMPTVGATEALVIAAKAFTRPDAPLVTAAPAYAAIATATEQLGHPVLRIPILETGGFDLDRMVEQSTGAGLIFLCNPHNPTGTLVPAAALEDFIRRVNARSPTTTILIGEVYHEYLDHPGYRSAIPQALRNPRVLVNRTFSKLYGLAGMRLGYLIGMEPTLKQAAVHRVPIGANAAGIAAALAVLGDDAERVRQRDLNREGRRVAEKFFTERGWRFYPAEANYLFVDVRRDIRTFRSACQDKGLLVGRHYPPADTWMRLTIGTPDEMRRALAILETLL